MTTPQPRMRMTVLLTLLAVLIPAQGINFSKQCEYRGYAPGAINRVLRSRAVEPAKFETSILQQGLDYFNTGSGVTAATLGMIDAIGDVMKAAPQMSAAIGIITVGMGFLNSTPSPQDILDRSFESVKLLSEEVNLMMDQMQDYADAKDLLLEKNIMNNNYRELFDRWSGCVEEVTTTRTIECQRSAVEALRSSRYHFQPLHLEFEQVTTDWEGRQKLVYDPDFDSRVSSGVWQWLKDECGSTMQCLTHDQVKRIEIGIIPFRAFATLHLFALKTLEASYRAQPINTDKEVCAYYKRYLNEMAAKGYQYARYARWAYEWTYIRQYEENDFYGVPGRPGGFRGRFLGTIKCSGDKCVIECVQVYTDKTCSATGASHATLEEKLFKKCETYIGKVKEQLNQFWNVHVLATAEQWKKYGDDAKAKLENLKCQS